MTRYVAMLRGVNVGGTGKVKMGDLGALFTALGHTDVKTYLQSGNVVFDSSERGTDRLAAAAEQAVSAELGLDLTVLIRTHADLSAVLTTNPYLDREDDLTKLPVTFLAAEPDQEKSAALTIPAGEPSVFTIVGREVYLHCPAGYGRTKLNNTFLERKLRVRATTRNWKTVTALYEMSSA